MIKAKIGGAFFNRVTAYGDTKELMAETATIIHEIFESMWEKLPYCAEMYRRGLVALLTDPDSPVWQIEREGDE